MDGDGDGRGRGMEMEMKIEMEMKRDLVHCEHYVRAWYFSCG
jgi:hypothetical protein